MAAALRGPASACAMTDLKHHGYAMRKPDPGPGTLSNPGSETSAIGKIAALLRPDYPSKGGLGRAAARVWIGMARVRSSAQCGAVLGASLFTVTARAPADSVVAHATFEAGLIPALLIALTR